MWKFFYNLRKRYIRQPLRAVRVRAHALLEDSQQRLYKDGKKAVRRLKMGPPVLRKLETRSWQHAARRGELPHGFWCEATDEEKIFFAAEAVVPMLTREFQPSGLLAKWSKMYADGYWSVVCNYACRRWCLERFTKLRDPYPVMRFYTGKFWALDNTPTQEDCERWYKHFRRILDGACRTKG